MSGDPNPVGGCFGVANAVPTTSRQRIWNRALGKAPPIDCQSSLRRAKRPRHHRLPSRDGPDVRVVARNTKRLRHPGSNTRQKARKNNFAASVVAQRRDSSRRFGTLDAALQEGRDDRGTVPGGNVSGGGNPSASTRVSTPHAGVRAPRPRPALSMRCWEVSGLRHIGTLAWFLTSP